MKPKTASYQPSASDAACRGKLRNSLSSLIVGMLLVVLVVPASMRAQSCPTNILPVGTPWNGPVPLTVNLGGGCTATLFYCWRDVQLPGSGAWQYQTAICPGTISLSPGCGQKLDFDKIEDDLLQTAAANSTHITPCGYDPITYATYRSVCWKRTTWCDDCSTTWGTCEDAALCKVTMNICYVVGVVYTSNESHTTLGNPSCSDTPIPTHAGDVQNDVCYLIDCSWNSLHHLP